MRQDSHVVYTGGTFDLLHAGHVALLRHCDQIAGPSGQVVVALNTDEFIAQFKGKPPVCTLDERMAVLLALRFVDQVVVNTGGADSRPTIEQVAPSVIVVGSDWAPAERYYQQMGFDAAWLAQRGIALTFVEREGGLWPKLSSSVLKTRLRSQDYRASLSSGLWNTTRRGW